MEEKIIMQTVLKIEQFLRQNRLKQAMDELSLLVAESKIWWATERERELSLIYQQLLDYSVKGINDGNRAEVLQHLKKELFDLTDRLKDDLLSKSSSCFEYQQKRNFPFLSFKDSLRKLDLAYDAFSLGDLISDTINQTSDVKELRLACEEAEKNLFLAILLSDQWGEDETESFEKMLKGSASYVSKSLFVSALTLHLLRLFDIRKLKLLFRLLSCNETEVRLRVIIALIFVLNKYDSRTEYSDTISVFMEEVSKSESLVKEFQSAVIQIIRTFETETITKKIQQEILPDMIRASSPIKGKWDETMKNADEDAIFEWYEFLEEKGLSDKLQAFGELQQEGADVYMSTFSGLKTFSFFNHVANWFLPFSPEHSQISRLFENDHSFLPLLVKSDAMCNSDKYSFCLSLIQMPDYQFQTMIEAFKMEAAQMKDDEAERLLLNPTFSVLQISNRYIQDLYRFYRLFPYKFAYNPFLELDEIVQRRFFKIIFELPNSKLPIADFCFLKKMYIQALPLLKDALEQDSKNAELCQKVGFCYQQMGQTDEALVYYFRADILNPKHKWTLRRIAYCYKKKGDFSMALRYYRQLEELLPENTSVLMNIGNCLLEQKVFEEALAVYFKIDYFLPDNVSVWRAIAWCSFLCEKALQAEKYYAKLLAVTDFAKDFILAGHVSFAMLNQLQAIDFYRKAYALLLDENRFFQIFDENTTELFERGVEPESHFLMSEYLRFEFKKEK